MVECLNRKNLHGDAIADSGSSIWVYEQLGVPDTELDSGYSVFSEETEHVYGKGDRCVEPAEVYEYLFKHTFDHFRTIKMLTGSLPSLVIDDFDAGTDRDAKFRMRIDKAISSLKMILKSKGYVEGTESFKDKLALGLFYYTYSPTQEGVHRRQMMFPQSLEGLSKKLHEAGLSEFAEYLMRAGGLGLIDMKGDDEKEVGALEALYEKNANCTERSKILFAVFSEAGLRPYFVIAETHEFIARFRRLFPDRIVPDGHVLVGVRMGRRFHYFDLALFDDDLQTKQPHIIGPREMATVELTTKAVEKQRTGLIGEARRLVELALDMSPRDGYAWYILGGLIFARGDASTFRDAEQAYRTSIKFDPDFWKVHDGLSDVLFGQGHNAEAVVEKRKSFQLDPNRR